MSKPPRPSWPTMAEYQEAVQAPELCFDDAALKQGRPVLNKLGLPRPICGQFASVYELEHTGTRSAIKCFLRNIPDLHARYAKIAAHLAQCTLPYFVTFDYLAKGIRVRGVFHPIVKMDWVEGAQLNAHFEKARHDRAAMERMEAAWLKLLEDLRSVHIAHADLQHGNVLVAPDGTLKLIDYDGMWVPKLKGETSHETGHPDYQSPLRTGRDFHEEIDRFAGEVIHVSIRALQRQPGLWDKYNNGDNLLFRRKDFLDPAASPLFAELRALHDDEITHKLDELAAACGAKPKRGRLSRFFGPKTPKPKPAVAGGAGQWKSDAPAKAPAPAPAAPAPRPAPAPPRPAAPQRPAPAPAPAPAQQRIQRAAPTRPPGPGGWLSDHVAVGAGVIKPAGALPQQSQAPKAVKAVKAAPAPKASKPPGTSVARRAPVSPADRLPLGKRLLGYLRILLHLVLAVPIITLLTLELRRLLDDDGDRATAILVIGFGTALFLGLLSFLSLFAARRMHRVVSTLFLGLSAVIMLVAIIAELLTVGWSDFTGDDPVECALMLTMLAASALGFPIELACRRFGVEARWRRP